MLEFISQPWPWYVSGTVIALIMALLLYFGKSFGFSSNLRVICAACGAGKKVSFFDFDWRAQTWNLLFLVGAVIGGFIASEFLSTGEAVQISQATIQDLSQLGISAPDALQPGEIFSLESLFTVKGFLILLLGGFMIGFGSRYAGGCTSGHAISGLSNLQLPSLIAVIGFFIGGLITTFVLLPLIF
ncbi:YeeE/YedE family protein [Pontibacter sp. BT310]|uniref:YeeE/YedE family protein n=1 Tax=Pontibacter populi TaxID=890055 RepID=A0ABS6XEZ5_9BACT|nr:MULTISPECIES: YeeE/YedE thiosulfate transporter family protein [Pontibacter]MBJ6119608.1 YeeE/YedE family protein [Pontibacter sp. BT310]MBR0572035.1 YeeE/YedE family protein [Microvirga sp. STS03]MBW3366461.1 YeeE/YedE family protein [Pontibacter populi]